MNLKKSIAHGLVFCFAVIAVHVQNPIVGHINENVFFGMLFPAGSTILMTPSTAEGFTPITTATAWKCPTE